MRGVNFRKHFPKTIALAFPVMLSQLGQVMVGVADSMMSVSERVDSSLARRERCELEPRSATLWVSSMMMMSQ